MCVNGIHRKSFRKRVLSGGKLNQCSPSLSINKLFPFFLHDSSTFLHML
ncbi:hypothetical protein HMPREF9406_3096 [Clostridium sp. HGF2]|nr:hypothetical protein HMPREF9406_3096 [Clostridium sp. HGF2]EQJ52112.1 hypothetical protein QSI_4140 [Clostridioides difficile P28]